MYLTVFLQRVDKFKIDVIEGFVMVSAAQVTV